LRVRVPARRRNLCFSRFYHSRHRSNESEIYTSAQTKLCSRAISSRRDARYSRAQADLSARRGERKRATRLFALSLSSYPSVCFHDLRRQLCERVYTSAGVWRIKCKARATRALMARRASHLEARVKVLISCQQPRDEILSSFSKMQST
jgi:hypothetical protein